MVKKVVDKLVEMMKEVNVVEKMKRVMKNNGLNTGGSKGDAEIARIKCRKNSKR